MPEGEDSTAHVDGNGLHVADGDTGAAAEGGTAARMRLASYARPALAGLLLVVVILGGRAALPASASAGPWHANGLALAGSLDVLLAAMLGVVQWRRRRRPADYPATELRTWLKNVLTAAVAVITVLVLLFLSGIHVGPIRAIRPRPLPHGRRIGGVVRPPRSRGGGLISGALVTDLLYAAGALVLLAAIAACVYLLWLRRTPEPVSEAAVDTPADDATLRQAVASGRAALHSVDDARAAIIACYVAMETQLARAGAARTAAETPDELLNRAQRTGLLRGPAATQLVGLFYEARFSTHVLAVTVRANAAAALEAISAELSRRADADPADAVPADAAAAADGAAADAPPAGPSGGAR